MLIIYLYFTYFEFNVTSYITIINELDKEYTTHLQMLTLSLKYIVILMFKFNLYINKVRSASDD